jgi:transketolase
LNNLKVLSYDLRKDVVDMIVEAKGGHIGGDMSVIDILICLYFKIMNISPENMDDPDRDRFVLSKGHSVEAYYAVLAAKGFLNIEEVKQQYSGSLGHGLPVCIGMALAGKMDRRNYRVYTVMGDGELAEGSVWEGAMAGGHYKLDNLCAVVDRNRLQISGSTEDVMAQDSQIERWKSFGWHTISVNGNDVDALEQAFTEARTIKGKPTVIIANTIKGYGSVVMENKANWHHKVPTQEEYEQIIADFASRKELALRE